MADYNDYDENLDEDQEEQEDQESKEQSKQFQLEEKMLKNKLNLLFAKVARSSKTKLSVEEQKDMKKAQQHPNLNGSITRVKGVLAINKAKMVYKVMSASPALWYVFIGAVLLLVIIAAIAAIASLMPWLFPDDNTGGSGGAVNATCGIKGTDFYGARMIYTDKDKATQSIVEDYVEFVENGILQAEQITSVTTENGENTFAVELIVDINLPDENYDYTQFNEVQFSGSFAELYNIVYDIAKVVYKIDNGEDFGGISLIQCVDEIKYFGFGNIDEIKTIVADAIKGRVSFTSEEDTGNVLTLDDVNVEIDNVLANCYSSYSTARTEKLFVKDYILQGEKMMEDIQKENYVAMIFMPRKNVTFTKISFIIGNGDLTNLKVGINGQTISSNGENLGNDESKAYLYSKTSIISAQKFTDIDENNLGALSEEKSLYDISNLANSSIYLTQETSEGENPVNYFTIKKEGVVVNLENDEPFIIVEFETVWATS